MHKRKWLTEFGDNLAAMLRETDMTQKELAERSGISETSISYYLQGIRAPTAKAIINIAYALDCSIDDLIDFGETID